MRDSSFINLGTLPQSVSLEQIEQSFVSCSADREKEKWDFCYYNFIAHAFYIDASKRPGTPDFFSKMLAPLFNGYYEIHRALCQDPDLARDQRAALSKKLEDPLSCILALMALGLRPEAGVFNLVENHIATLEGKGTLVPIGPWITSDLRHALNKELQKISSQSLKSHPYELLRAGIYFEIQRIENCAKSHDDPAAKKARELRQIMHGLTKSLFNSGFNSGDNYVRLKEALLASGGLFAGLNTQRPSYGFGFFWNRLVGLKQTQSLKNVLNLQQRIDAAFTRPVVSPAVTF